MPKHFFFDLDNTLTRSKSHIAPEHVPILKALCSRVDVIVVSGHGGNDIRAHLEKELDGLYYVLGQNGNLAEEKDGTVIWKRELTPAQKEAAFEFARKAQAHLNLSVRDENDIVDDRGCQVAYSLIGHHEDKAKKEAFDPDHKIRHKLLADLADDARALEDAGVEIRSGGTTVLDMFGKGQNKGHNVRAFTELKGWDTAECIYIGDALFPGGNDETVIGILPTRPVKDYRETYEYLSSILG